MGKNNIIEKFENPNFYSDRLLVINFCERFVEKRDVKKFIFGRNLYCEKLVETIEFDGFIDDFTKELEFLGKPIFKLDDISSDALILVASGGRPLTAIKKLKERGFECLDYFAFYRFSGVDLTPVRFMEDQAADFAQNENKYLTVLQELADETSKEQFLKLVNFKNTLDIRFLEGFKWAEDKQYFESFLGLKKSNETFLDIGCYDGFTSESFIQKCPEYENIHIFEPDPENMSKVKQRLSEHQRIIYHKLGLSDKKEILKMNVGGSCSGITEDGSLEIEVDRLSNIVKGKATFIKMDIEGAEERALDGCKNVILNYHPKIAVSVYHKSSDFWKIPEQIFSIRSDYSIYLRHYTESIYETVMFFVPKQPILACHKNL